MQDSKRHEPAIAFAAWMVAALVAASVIELFSCAALSLTRHQWFSYARLQAARAAVAAGRTQQPNMEGARAGEAPDWIATEVIHPYLGFVLDRAIPHPCNPDLDGYHDAMEYGFPCSEAPLIEKRSSDTVIVGLYGGSVAAGFATYGAHRLTEELHRFPPFANKRIRIASFSVPGYKQPQQLMALSYFLMLGAQFDLVVNLDGFNEVALPATENAPKGVFPFFPRSWYFRTASFDTTTRRAMGEVSFLEDRRVERARAFSRAPWRYSASASLVWSLLDRLDETRIARLQNALLKAPSPQHAYVTTGPTRTYATADAIYPDSADVWRRGSSLMNQLATANGAVYFDFLQPNQYVAGSKPFTDAERRVALTDPFGFMHSVEVGYPLLQRAGMELARGGVHFHDMTGVFAKEGQSLYIDACCHFNPRGYDILAHAMGRAIVDDLRTKAANSP
jgi:hypothetical protein